MGKSTKPGNPSPGSGQRAGAGKAKAPRASLLQAPRHTILVQRRELDNFEMAQEKKLDSSGSGSATTPASDLDVYKSLSRATAVNWERTNAQTGGLLDWVMDEMQAMLDEDGVRATVQRARAPRGRLTGDHAVAIFLCRR